MNSPILTQQRENFLQVTLNRPEVFNALNRDMMKMLAETLGVAATDTSIQGIVITGTGKAFCTRGDLKAISQQGEDWGTVLHQLAPLFHLAVTEI